MNRLSYKLLMLLTVIATLGGLLTLMPWPKASYPNLINYYSFCTFTPAASLYCFLIAGISCFIRSIFIKDASGSPKERFRKHSKSLVPLTVLLVLALIFNVRYIRIKNYYADTVGSVSIEAMEE